MAEVFLGLGSNINREQNLKSAVGKLGEEFGSITLSPVYESAAVGFSGDNFLNLVVKIETDMNIGRLDQWLKGMEDQHGRVRDGEKFCDRTLDIDILAFGRLEGNIEGIQLPRDEIFNCAFVLKPFQDIAGDLVLPGQEKSLSQLWECFDRESQPLSEVQLFL